MRSRFEESLDLGWLNTKADFYNEVIGKLINDKHSAAAGGLMEHALSPLCPLRHQPRFLAKLKFAIAHNRFAPWLLEIYSKKTLFIFI